MRTEEIIILLIALPAFIFLSLFLYLKSKKFKNKPKKIYHLILFAKEIILTKHDLTILIVLFIFFSWLSLFLDIGFAILITIITAFSFPIAVIQIKKSSETKQTTEKLIQKLSVIESEIDDVKQQFSVLQADLSEAQLAVEQKQKVKEELEKQIIANKKSAETWSAMTEEQKNLVSQTTVNAISKKLKGEFWPGLLLGFVINILATLVWTLLGNPGKDDLIKKFTDLIKIL